MSLPKGFMPSKDRPNEREQDFLAHNKITNIIFFNE
jgi:hypothetical protein